MIIFSTDEHFIFKINEKYFNISILLPKQTKVNSENKIEFSAMINALIA